MFDRTPRTNRSRTRAATGPAPSRRTFLKGLGAAGAAGVSMAHLPLDAEVAGAQGDGRSLVCIFLFGGADSFNMVVPNDHAVAGQNYNTYSTTRGEFAVPRASLLPIHDGAFGLNPGLPGLASVAAAGQLAVVNNVGPLIRPTTREDFLGSVPMPQFLFGHGQQQKLWQTARPNVSIDDGWGGSIAAANTAGTLSPAFSIFGSTPWLASPSLNYARLSATVGIERLLGYDASLRSWIDSFEGLQTSMEAGLTAADASPNPFDQAASTSLRRSVMVTEELEDILDNTDVGMENINPRSLAGRLEVVAQLIANRGRLGQQRQVFFVGLGGWDTHGEQADRFPELLAEFDEGVTAFQGAIDRLRVADSVTTFTASDFGRTLTSNGDGTDHGWGGNAFVWGGAVNSGSYGTFPNLTTTNNPDDTTDERGNFAGRMIPTTSVAQYGATLARWMGLGEGQLDLAFPELRNFATRDLGFMS